MSWEETKPSSGDPLSEFPSMLTKHMEDFRVGIEKAFLWTQSSGLSAGEPLYSSGSTKGGAARAFYGPQSDVSAAKDGALMVTSDTRRLFYVGSEVVQLGGDNIILSDVTLMQSSVTASSFVTLPVNSRWVVKSGYTDSLTTTNPVSQLFGGTLYLGTPRVLVTPVVSTATLHAFRLAVTSVNSSGMSISFYKGTGAGSAASWGYYWRSEGTITLW